MSTAADYLQRVEALALIVQGALLLWTGHRAWAAGRDRMACYGRGWTRGNKRCLRWRAVREFVGVALCLSCNVARAEGGFERTGEGGGLRGASVSWVRV